MKSHEFSPAFVAPVRSSKPLSVRPGDVAPTAATPPRPGRAFAPPRPTGGSTSPSYLGRSAELQVGFDQDSGRGKNRGEILVLLGDDMHISYLNRGSMNGLNSNVRYLIAGIGANRVTVTFTYRILFWG